MRFWAIVLAALVAQPCCAWVRGGSYGIGANRGQVATSTTSIAANTTSRREHYSHPDGAISQCQTVDSNILVNGTTGDPYTIKRYIEYPANTFTQVTWKGLGTVTVGSGGTVFSDPINLTIPKATEFWERTVNLNNTVANFPQIALPNAPNVIGVDDGNAATDKGNSGTIAPGASPSYFGSTTIICNIAAPKARSFVIVGDSINYGYGDISSVGAAGGSGYVARLLDVRGYPYLKIAETGQAASDFATNAKTKALIALLPFSDAIVEYGTNDLTYGASVSTVLASLQTIYGFFSGKNVYQTTLTPKSNSTDGWMTEVNQTARSDGNNSNLGTLNDAIRVPQANVNVVLDAAAVAMPSLDADIWIAPPVPTTDGTHPNSYEAGTLAAGLSLPYLLKRDLDPAANDNSPMWLNKAA